MKAKRTFVVGRRTPKSTLMVIVESSSVPIRGPWTLRAVVEPRPATG